MNEIEKHIKFHKEHEQVSQITEALVDETSERADYKIPCQLIPSSYQLQIKWIVLPNDFIYAYQLYSDCPLIRWDNAPHFPNIQPQPHHFHDKHGVVKSSQLKGNVKNGLTYILKHIIDFIYSEIENNSS